MDNEGSTVVLSGGTGYIGGWLMQALLHRGFQVLSVARSPQPARAGVVAIDSAMPADDLVAALVNHQPSAVIHAAGLGGAEVPLDNWRAVIEANITVGTLLMETAARSTDASHRCGFISYGTFWQRSSDSGTTGPNSFYAATKNAAADIAAYYGEQRGVAAVELQLSDVYGPDDPRSRLVQALVEACRAGEDLSMSAGEQVVSFVHVDDVVAGTLHVVNGLAAAQPGLQRFSIHGPDIATLRTTVRNLETTLGVNIPVSWGSRPYRPNEVFEPSFLDLPSGWQPAISFPDGFKKRLSTS